VNAPGRRPHRRTRPLPPVEPDPELERELQEVQRDIRAMLEQIRADGWTVRGSRGQPRPHPLLGALKTRELERARLLRRLRRHEEEARPALTLQEDLEMHLGPVTRRR
jgi:hypothetical protein